MVKPSIGKIQKNAYKVFVMQLVKFMKFGSCILLFLLETKIKDNIRYGKFISILVDGY